MKIFFVFFAFILISINTPIQAVAGYFPEQAIASGESFISILDQQDLSKAYAATSELLQISTSEQQWIEQQQISSKLLGKVHSRRLMTFRNRDSYPGLPDGHYLVISYQSHTEFKAEAIEMLLLHQEGDSWKVCDYSIR